MSLTNIFLLLFLSSSPLLLSSSFFRPFFSFPLSGWVDEANTAFVDLIDNAATGNRFIYNAVGAIPTTTWQIDPFGHTAWFAAWMAGPISGNAGTFFARSD
jgi:hypothetical protein